MKRRCRPTRSPTGRRPRRSSAATRYRDLRRPEGTPGKTGAPMDEEGLAALRGVAAHYAETQIAGPASYAIVEALLALRGLPYELFDPTA